MKTNEFLSILKDVIPATTNKGLVEGMNMLICADGAITAYNDKISISRLAPEDLSKIEFAVIATDLLPIIQTIKAEEMQIYLIDENNIDIVSDDVQATLAIQTTDVIKDMLNALKLSTLTFDDLPTDFTKALNMCSFAASTDMNDAQLMYCIVIDGTQIIATDRHRISVYTNNDWDFKMMMLPYYSADKIKALKPNGYCVDHGWAHFINEDDTILSCRVFNNEVIADKFFEYAEHIADITYGNSIDLPSELISALENMVSFSDETNSADKIVTLDFAINNLRCKMEKSTGKFTKKLKIKNDSFTSKLKFSAMFLKEILALTHTIYLSENTVQLRVDNFAYTLSQHS